MELVQQRHVINLCFMFAVCVLCPLDAETFQLDDLSGCEKVEHKKNVVHDRRAPQARQGWVLSLLTGAVVVAPWEADETLSEPRDIKELRRKLSQAGAGDLVYSKADGGVLVVISGVAARLGKGLLADLSDDTFQKPGVATGSVNGSRYVGVIDKAGLGERFLVRTVDGSYALVRITAVKENGIQLEWVFSNGEPLTFDLSGAKVVEVPMEEVVPEQNLPGGNEEPLFPADADEPPAKPGTKVADHLANREKVIRQLINTLRDDDADLIEKVTAVKSLGQMRAVEAAPLLATLICLFDRFHTGGINMDRMYPCVPALVKIGKPGSDACFQRILAGELEEGALMHLALVIKRVEGRDAAVLLVESALKDATDQKLKDRLQKVHNIVKGPPP